MNKERRALFFHIDDVREAVLRLKELVNSCEYDDFDRTFAIDRIDDIFGDKLI